jgi:hypothetical protein
LARVGAVAGMLVGGLGPWVILHGNGRVLAASGWSQGGAVVVALAITTAISVAFHSRGGAAACAALAVLWIVAWANGMPDSLFVGDVYQVEWAWGVYVSLASALVLLASSLVPGAPSRISRARRRRVHG